LRKEPSKTEYEEKSKAQFAELLRNAKKTKLDPPKEG
jgi:hypothetical protein